MSQYDFNYFKDKVTITQVAEALGYKFNPNKGKGKMTEFMHPNETSIIISKPSYSVGQMYFTRNDDMDKGTVIDFVKNRLNKFNVSYNTEVEGINKVLSQFAQIRYEETKPNNLTPNIISPIKPEPFNPNDYKIHQASINDLGYLINGRKISIETLKVFSDDIYIIQKYNANNKYINIGFPYKKPGDNTFKGFEIVNYGWHQHAKNSDKTNSVWLADLSKNGIVTNIYFGESAIDLISFYEINKSKISINSSAFISTGGNLSSNQVTNVLNAFPYAKIHTTFDNDLAGNLYDIRIAALQLNKTVRISKKGENVHFQLMDKEFSLHATDVSLTAFRKLSDLRPSIKVFKPIDGKDFNQMLQQSKLNEWVVSTLSR